MTSVLLVFIFCSVFSTCNADTVSIFNRQSHILCDLQERVELECSTEITEADSIIRCTSLCESEPGCIGASFDEDQKCFIHQECSLISGCTVQHPNHDYVSKHCVHGTWNVLTKSCDCTDGAHGDRCNQFYTGCHDLLAAGYNQGRHRVYLDPDQNGINPVLVQCYVMPGYSAPQMIKNEGIHDFNRTWNDYRKGFYYDIENMWAGLEPWHQLSKYGGCTEAIYFIRLGDSGIYRTLNNFVLNEDYTFTFEDHTMTTGYYGSGFSNAPSFGYCFKPLQTFLFSTWDNDSDNNTDENCAAKIGSGWWFSESCDQPCNFLGYGFQFWNETPVHQWFSVSGMDLSRYSSEDVFFNVHLICSA